jgi:hypothetical protein
MRSCKTTGCSLEFAARGYCIKCYNKFVYELKPDVIKRRRDANYLDATKRNKLYYRKSFNGYLRETYARLRNKLEVRKVPYICSWEEFRNFSIMCTNYLNLHRHWTLSNYALGSAPAPVRLDPRYGYSPDNFEWLRMCDTNRLASASKRFKGRLLNQIREVLE